MSETERLNPSDPGETERLNPSDPDKERSNPSDPNNGKEDKPTLTEEDNKALKKANTIMTTKTVSLDIMSGVSLRHAVVKYINIKDRETGDSAVDKAVLGLTISIIALQVFVILLLLWKGSLKYYPPNPWVLRITRLVAISIGILAIFDTVCAGIESTITERLQKEINTVGNAQPSNGTGP